MSGVPVDDPISSIHPVKGHSIVERLPEVGLPEVAGARSGGDSRGLPDYGI